MSECFTQEAFGFGVEVANLRFWLAVVAGRWMLDLRSVNLHRFNLKTGLVVTFQHILRLYWADKGRTCTGSLVCVLMVREAIGR